MIQIAFYKGEGTYIDRLIRWGTNTPYSHVELIGPDGKGWSASPREGIVRKKEIDWESGHWDIITVDWKDLEIVSQDVEAHMGKRYDYRSIISNHVFSLIRSNPDRWFCSELIACALGFYQPETFSPGSLYNVLVYINHVQGESRA